MAATHTTYYNLNKPDRQDFVSVVTDINDNMDMIDAAMHGLDTNKIDESDKGVANGVASLDASGKVPSSQLPSYVDDVVEGYLYNGQFYEESAHTTVITPESDKIYVDIPTSTSYRWGGSLYVKIDDPTEVIDDNAGAGDTDKTYSADKIVKLIDGKADMIEEVISTPASVMSFSDGADNLPMKVVFGVDPVQDLHGYDHPWPYGGSKNLYDQDEDYYGKGKNWNANSGTLVDNEEYYGSPKIPVKENTQYTRNAGANSNIFYDSNGERISSATGKTFTTPAGTSYVAFNIENSVDHSTVQLEERETSTSYVPAKNICPISGWTGANVEQVGKNWLPMTNWTAGKYLNASGNLADSNGTINTSDFFPVRASTQYIYDGTNLHKSGNNTSVYIQVCLYDSSKNFINRSANITTGNASFVTTDNTAFVRVSAASDATELQVELGLNPTLFEPYTAYLYPITFPSQAGTVYGGTLTVNKDGTGTLVVDRAIVDLGSVEWTTMTKSATFRTYSQIADMKPVTDNSDVPNLLSDRYVVDTWNHVVDRPAYDMCIAEGWASKAYIALTDTTFTGYSASEFKTAITGSKLVYELATPVTYSFTAPQVKTLLGVNNIWADTGNILLVDYPADTKLYIDKKFAELQALILEN